jgi:uncharacterized protein YbbC (DUF1343 family)
MLDSKKRWIIFPLTLFIFQVSLSHSSFAGSTPQSAHQDIQKKRLESPVKLGSDRIFEPQFWNQLKGKRLGILAHAASRTQDGAHVVDFLASLRDLNLKMIFAPEHGYRSVDDQLLPDSQDPVTGLPVYSLYGPRKAPTDQMLSEVDAVLIDLQDVGLRYYTYPATLVYTMQACQQNGKKVFVLDRPNPLGGQIVEGAMLEKQWVDGGLVTLASVPTRHGMTLGELALYYNRILGIGADLTVIPMSGWKRDMLWEGSKLGWYPPSPALTTPEQTYLYALFGTLESSNLAVGRGKSNDQAFHLYGAPWITEDKSTDLLRELQKLKLSGLKFSAANWIPDRAAYQGKRCRGFRVDVTDRDRLQGLRSLILVLQTMRSVLGPSLQTLGMNVMLGANWLREGIEIGAPLQSLLDRAELESQDFLKFRQEALLY